MFGLWPQEAPKFSKGRGAHSPRQKKVIPTTKERIFCLLLKNTTFFGIGWARCSPRPMEDGPQIFWKSAVIPKIGGWGKNCPEQKVLMYVHKIQTQSQKIPSEKHEAWGVPRPPLNHRQMEVLWGSKHFHWILWGRFWKKVWPDFRYVTPFS